MQALWAPGRCGLLRKRFRIAELQTAKRDVPRRTFECGSAPQLQSALNDVAHAAFDKAGKQQRETVAVSSRKRMRFGWLARTAFLFLGVGSRLRRLVVGSWFLISPNLVRIGY